MAKKKNNTTDPGANVGILLPETMRRITVKVIPRAKQNQVLGTLNDDTIKVRLTAPPVDGAANKALIDLLSEVWDIPKSRIRVVKGETSRLKIVEVD